VARVKGKAYSGCAKAQKDMRRNTMQKLFFNLLHEKVQPGTFNVRISKAFDEGMPYAVDDTGLRKFYRIDIIKPKFIRVWLYRRENSRMTSKTLELISEVNLREYLKVKDNDEIVLEYTPLWSKNRAVQFAKKVGKWFQSFDFVPEEIQQSNSKKVWKAMALDDVRGKTVLDIGGRTGYYSIKLWELGAKPTLFERDKKSIEEARTIIKHINPANIDIIKKSIISDESEKRYDIILYLSVHHQFDPTYAGLDEMVKKLAKRTKEMLFIELMLPFKGHGSVEDAELVFSGYFSRVEKLISYNHKLRGVRHLWRCEK